MKNYTIQKRDEFAMIGISVRTSNRDNQAGKDISALFQRFFAEGIMEKIPGRLSDDIINLYYDYAGDHTDPYTVLVGCRVSSLDDLPAGLTGHKVAGGSFAVYTPKGDMPDIIINTWQEVWQTEEYQRSYQGDYDIYGPKAMDPDMPEVEICVGIKKA